MTTTATDPNATDPAPNNPDQPDQQGNPDTDQQQDATPNAEAARFRKALRAAETERDGLRERLTGWQKAEAEKMAGATLARPSSLWAAGVQLDDVLDADGRVDPEKLTAAVTDAADRLGLARPVPQPPKAAIQPGARCNRPRRRPRPGERLERIPEGQMIG